MRAIIGLQSDFVRNVLTLVTGTTIAQALPVLTSPILSRIYSPADLGVLTLYTGILALLAPAATGAYENAIVLPKSDDDALHVAVLSIVVVLAVSAAALLAMVLFKTPIASALNAPEVSTWLYLVPLGVLLTGVYRVLTYWAIRDQHYRRTSTSRIAQSAGTVSANLGMGIAGLGTGGLIIGSLIGQVLGVSSLGWQAWSSGRQRRNVISRAHVIRQAIDYQDFPKYNLPQAFLDGLRESSIIFCMSLLFGPPTVGLYGFALRVLRTPLSVLGSSVGQVFYQRAVSAYNADQDVWPLLRQVIGRLTLMAVPVLLVLLLLGPQLFSIVFGYRWEAAGEYARVLAPWFLVNLVSSPVSQIPLILRRQRAFLFVGIGYNGLVPITFFLVASATHDIARALACVAAVGTAYLVGVIIWFANVVRAERKPS